MKYTLNGPISHIFDTQTIGAKGFQKREFVVTLEDGRDGEWDEPIKFELVKDRCDTLDHFKIGDRVDVHFAIRGNEHNDKFFVSLRAISVVHEGATGRPDTYRHGTDQASRPPDRGDAMAEHEANRAQREPQPAAPAARGEDADSDIPF